MAKRSLCALFCLGAWLSVAASYRTPNFVVDAPNAQIAQQVGQYAEHYRREKAMLWLGYEMPQWPQPCPLRVTITMGGSGGATSFGFDRGQVLYQKMQIEGTLERLLASVLPHEVTHTVFAFYFRQPVPRWADEGGSVLSEDQLERNRHDKLVRNMLNNRRAMPLRRLFALKEYPPDVMVLYAQGYSVTDFLVGKSSRPEFLNFIADGLQRGWDQSVQTHYGYRNVDELEQAWLQHLKNTKQQPPTEVASRDPKSPGAAADAASREPKSPTTADAARQVVVRQTVPPAQPFEPGSEPVYRGAAPESDASFRPAARKNRPAPPALEPMKKAPPLARLGPPQFVPLDRSGVPMAMPGYSD